MRKLLKNTMTLALLFTASTSAFAGGGRDPASVLIYPIYNSKDAATVISIVNTNQDTSFDPSTGEAKGTTWVHFNYIDAATCSNNDVSVKLTPNDTFQTLANAHAPAAKCGYLYVYAETGPHSGIAKSWNYLIGDLLAIDGILCIQYSANSYGFRSPLKDNEVTDLDGDKVLDFDDKEYEAVPDQLLFPHFFGQDDGQKRGNGIDGCIALVGLVGSKFDIAVNFDIYNDNESHFSAYGYEFTCWAFPKLASISGAFTETFLDSQPSDDPNELFGFPQLNVGWFSLDGDTATSSTTTIENPAVLALYVERVRYMSAADLPWHRGTQLNGALLPRGVGGDQD